MSRAHEEVEFKAGVDADTLAAVRRLPLLRRSTVGRAEARHLLSVYYDTGDLRLRAAGLFLRMRRVAGCWEQTIKAARRAPRGLHRVIELTDLARGPQPDLSLVSSPGLRRALRNALGGADLEPVFRTEIRRTIRRLGGPEGDLELALDRGRIIVGEFSSEFCEIELECIDCAPSVAFSWADRLLGGRAARLLQPSKAARGFALARGEPLEGPAPMHVRPADLAPVSSAQEAFSGLFDLYARAVAENLYCVMSADDPKAVHQLRVTLRRLRALLRAGKESLCDAHCHELRRQARDMGRLLSALRDADVLIDGMARPLLRDDRRETRLVGTVEAWREHIRCDTRAALRHARATGYAVQLLELAELERWRPRGRKQRRQLQEPLLDFLAPALQRAWEQVREHGAHLRKLTVDERHALRKDLKRLRYTAEIAVLAAEAPDAKRFFRLLGTLQDDLGLLNDLATLERQQQPVANRAAAKTFELLAQRLRSEGTTYPEKVLARAIRHWRQLKKEGPFWQQPH